MELFVLPFPHAKRSWTTHCVFYVAFGLRVDMGLKWLPISPMLLRGEKFRFASGMQHGSDSILMLSGKGCFGGEGNSRASGRGNLEDAER